MLKILKAFLILLTALILSLNSDFRIANAAAKNIKSANTNNNNSQKEDNDLKRERAIGEKAVAQIEKEWPLISNPEIQARLEMILNRLEPYMSRRIDWEIKLVKTDNVNAFCLPGGFIFFTTGILDILNSDSEIAAVMAHEMTHADRKHSLRMAAESQKITLGALAVMLLSSGAAAPIILAQLAQVAITNSYTMELETEADSIGLETIIKAGYSPSGMVTLFEKFINEELRQPVIEYGIYMNHPETRTRISRVLTKMRELKIPVQRKFPLGLLHTEIKDNVLSIDGIEILKSEILKLNEAKDAIDKYLQLELAPHDVYIMNGKLFIANHFITDINAENTRKNILKALDAAKSKYPATKYYQ